MDAIQVTPEGSSSAGAPGGEREGLARAGMRAGGDWRQGKGRDGRQQGGILGEGQALGWGREFRAYVGQINWVQVVKLAIKTIIPVSSGSGIQPRTGLSLHRENEKCEA